ncbi:MAG: hypothetical protein Kow0090_05000 [Myxococcota bacterium]
MTIENTIIKTTWKSSRDRNIEPTTIYVVPKRELSEVAPDTMMYATYSEDWPGDIQYIDNDSGVGTSPKLILNEDRNTPGYNLVFVAVPHTSKYIPKVRIVKDYGHHLNTCGIVSHFACYELYYNIGYHEELDYDLDGLSDRLETILGTNSEHYDTDNDGLGDRVEVIGYMDQPMPFNGANPLKKDIFVEIDWMGDVKWDGTSTTPIHDHNPDFAIDIHRNTIDEIERNFKTALDSGDKEYTEIHIDVDEKLPHYEKISFYNKVTSPSSLPDPDLYYANDNDYVNFYWIKNGHEWSVTSGGVTTKHKLKPNFNPNRRYLYHYAIFAHDLIEPNKKMTDWQVSHSSGVAEFGTDDFVVALIKNWEMYIGTFIHA